MNYNNKVMIPHNIFDNSVELHNNSKWSTPSNIENTQRHEEDYVQLTPISPIKLSSYAMDQVTPGFETEAKNRSNDNFVIEQLIDLLQSQSDVVKFEAASSMLQLITDETAKKVVELDGIFCLAKGLDSNEEVVRDECSKCLRKLASISPPIRDSVIVDEGLISLLYKLNTTMSDSSRRITIEAISECFNDETHKPSLVACDILIPQFVDLLNKECNEFVINEICKGITYVCPGNVPCIKALIDHGVKARLTLLLTHQNEMVVTAALRAIRCLVVPKTHLNQQHQSTLTDNLLTSRHQNFVGRGKRQSPSRVLRDRNIVQAVQAVCSPAKKSVPRAAGISKECSSETRESSSPARDAVSTSTNNTSTRHVTRINDEWTVSPLISSTQVQSQAALSELDLITCQNVELFKATEDDTNDREAEAGSVIIGQVGLRCVHCGQSPFAKAQFSTVYPGSISLLPASLRHMAEKHIQNCEQTPFETRKRVHDLCMNTGNNCSNRSALKKFCVEFCMSVGVANRRPQRSGLVIDESVKTSSVVAPQKVFSTPTRQIVPVSLFHPLGSDGKVQFSPPHKASPLSYFQKNHDLPLQARRIYLAPPVPPETGMIFPSAPHQEHNRGTHIHVDRVKNKMLLSSIQVHEAAHCRQPLIHDTNMKKYGSPVSRTNQAARQAFTSNRSTQQGNSPLRCIPVNCGQVFISDRREISANDRSTATDYDSGNVSSNPIKGKEPLQEALMSPSDSINDNRTEMSSKADFLIQNGLDYGAESSNTDILRPGDENLLTDYVFYTMCQFKSCQFSKESDGNRRSGPISKPKKMFEDNYPGLQCIHCVNGNHPRKFFCSKVERLSHNVHEMSTHLSRCKHFPPEMKAKLENLKELRQKQQGKIPRGSQRKFFSQVWDRLQGKTVLPEENKGFHPRCVAEPDDNKWFSEYECVMRKGIQIFCATKFDVSFWKASIRKLDVKVGQIGLRCLYCAREEMDTGTVDLDATIFPTEIANIRNDMAFLYQRHHPKCTCAPHHIKASTVSAKKIGPVPSDQADEKFIAWAQKLGLYNSKGGVILCKQKSFQASNQEHDTISMPLETTLNSPSSLSHSGSFDEILPNAPLEILDVNANVALARQEEHVSLARQDVMDVDASPLPNDNNGVRRDHVPSPISSVISVTPCVPGGKRKSGDATLDEELTQPPPKRYCAV